MNAVSSAGRERSNKDGKVVAMTKRGLLILDAFGDTRLFDTILGTT